MNISHSHIQKEQLNKLIEKKRKQMIKNGLQYGFTNKKTIDLSQELDKLINEFILLGGVLRED